MPDAELRAALLEMAPSPKATARLPTPQGDVAAPTRSVGWRE